VTRQIEEAEAEGVKLTYCALLDLRSALRAEFYIQGWLQACRSVEKSAAGSSAPPTGS
jgi:hypothetical protein